MDYSEWAYKDEAASRVQEILDEKNGNNFRSPYARDRDRILYSKSFRRLSHKTQVYLTSSSHKSFDDHCRTRLTHTLEVAQIAESIASSLHLNTSLTEAIAFGHDVGHSPFGHAGERQINDFLSFKVSFPKEVSSRIKNFDKSQLPRKHFKHNFQSVRLLSLLERYSPYERGYGLNLSHQTLWGILKHTKLQIDGQDIIYPNASHLSFSDLIENKHYKSIEASIVAIADEIAQVVHDLCDAIKIKALSLAELEKSQVWSIILRCIGFSVEKNKNVDLSLTGDIDESIAQLCTAIVHYFTVNTSEWIKKTLSSYTPQDIAEVADLITTPIPQDDFNALASFKKDIVVNNYSVNRMDNKGRYIIRGLFKSYTADPRQLPDHILSLFLKMKRQEISNKGSQFFEDWLKRQGRHFDISPLLTEEQIKECCTVISTVTDGLAFRNVNRDIIYCLVPYLALDADYLRVIADYISSMTDVFAEKEYQSLYI
jgi:dGTPase